MTSSGVGGDNQQQKLGASSFLRILYGSQRGTSEQAAKDFHTKIVDKTKDTTGRVDDGLVICKPVELDDFLQEKKKDNDDPCWTGDDGRGETWVIFVSSFGEGGPPSGAKEFRQQCEDWFYMFPVDQPYFDKPLDGVQFALCGLGDSTFEDTHLRNPQKICKGLLAGGATLIGGEMGTADAAAGKEEQQQAIKDWTDAIVPKLLEPFLIKAEDKECAPGFEV